MTGELMDTPENGLAVENEASENAEKKSIDISVNIQELSSCERRITVTVPENEIKRYFAMEVDELQDVAHVPGFRVGKAPKKLVERRFRKEVADRIKSNIVLDSLEEVNGRDDLTPISEPDFNFEALVIPETGDFVFEFTLEVRPEFDLPQWKGLKINRPVRDFSATDIDSVIDRILASQGTLATIDEPAAPGSYIVAKLTTMAGDAVLSTAENETLCLRPTLSFHDGSILKFDEQMTGLKAGDTRTLDVTLTEDATAFSVYGNTLKAVFDIIEVKELKVPELNDDLLEEMGFDSIGDLRDAILNRLQLNLEYEQHQQVRQQITNALTVAAEWTLPNKLLESQSHRELQRRIMELQRSGYSDDEIMAQINYIRQNNKAIVTQSLKEHFVLEKIAEVENIEVSESDYETEIAQIAAQTEQSPRRVRAQLEKAGQMDLLHNQVVERKVINLILENAVFTEVPYEITDNSDEALDRATTSEESDDEIPELSEDDEKAANREEVERKYIDPTAK